MTLPRTISWIRLSHRRSRRRWLPPPALSTVSLAWKWVFSRHSPHCDPPRRRRHLRRRRRRRVHSRHRWTRAVPTLFNRITSATMPICFRLQDRNANTTIRCFARICAKYTGVVSVGSGATPSKHIRDTDNVSSSVNNPALMQTSKGSQCLSKTTHTLAALHMPATRQACRRRRRRRPRHRRRRLRRFQARRRRRRRLRRPRARRRRRRRRRRHPRRRLCRLRICHPRLRRRRHRRRRRRHPRHRRRRPLLFRRRPCSRCTFTARRRGRRTATRFSPLAPTRSPRWPSTASCRPLTSFTLRRTPTAARRPTHRHCRAFWTRSPRWRSRHPSAATFCVCDRTM